MKADKTIFLDYSGYETNKPFFYYLVKKCEELQESMETSLKPNIKLLNEGDCYYIYLDTMRYLFYFLTGYHITQKIVPNPANPKEKLYEFTLLDKDNHIVDSFHCTKSVICGKPKVCSTSFIKEFEKKAMVENPIIRYMHSLKNFKGEYCLSEKEYEEVYTEILNEFIIRVWLEKEKRHNEMCKEILALSSETVELSTLSYPSKSIGLQHISFPLAIALLASLYRSLFYKLFKKSNKCYLDKNKSYKSIIEKFKHNFPKKEKIDTLLLQKKSKFVKKEKSIARNKLEEFEKSLDSPKKGSKVYIWDRTAQKIANDLLNILPPFKEKNLSF